MNLSTLDILRCPYCGGRLELVTTMFHRRDGDDIHDGILGCQCCIFAIVDGIPIMHLEGSSTAARAHVEAGRPDLARRAMFNLDDEAHAARFDEVASSQAATYRDVVDALGPTFEGGYFLYRFSDPTYIVADAVVRSVAGTVLENGGRAIDLCGGSGHLTRSLLDLSTPAPVLADLYFSKIWLGRRFTAPGCEGVCCDGNAPLPFARRAFRYAMCTDAFMYIWTKRQFIGEMTRLVDDGDGGGGGAIVIGHTHNERTWSPSHGQPLNQDGYRNLFETIEPRIFGEAGLFRDVVKGGPLDLGRRDAADVIDADPALTIIASRNPEVFKAHPLEAARAPRGEYGLNPLYAAEQAGDRTTLRLRFPNEDYEQEYGACRQYLPEEVTVTGAVLGRLAEGRLTPELAELARRRVVLDLPKRYY
jgi:uncharacterized protein YbaR (Trm112 family)